MDAEARAGNHMTNQYGQAGHKNFPQVPKIYQGAWRRDFIRRSNGEFDDTTECWWLQSPTYHIDLRIPADRPTVRKTNDIEALDEEARHRLDRQTAWVGVTQVEGSHCQWWPFAAIPQLGEDADIGLMKFLSKDEVIETCPEGRYQERWLRGSRADRRCVGLRLESIVPVGVRLTLVFLDDMAGLALERDGVLAEVQIAASSNYGGWLVIRSSLPWAEGGKWPADLGPQLFNRQGDALIARPGAIINWAMNGIAQWTVLEISA